MELSHWGRVTHICVRKLTIIGSDNDLSPDRHQAIISTCAGMLLIEPLGTNFNEFFIEIKISSLTNFNLKVWSVKVAATLYRPQCVKHCCRSDDDVIKWKHFPRYWPFVPFSLICVWMNGCVNNREAGDLRRYRAHYDVIVMSSPLSRPLTSILLISVDLMSISITHRLMYLLYYAS